MATKTINTRIKNRFDTLTNWQKDGVTILPGEIAVVKVPTGQTYTNPITGVSEPVSELLIKVGDYQYNTDGTVKTDSDGNKLTKAFADLPWLSAKASDVYNWAKTSTIEGVSASIRIGTDSTATSKTLGEWLKTFADTDKDQATTLESILFSSFNAFIISSLFLSCSTFSVKTISSPKIKSLCLIIPSLIGVNVLPVS